MAFAKHFGFVSLSAATLALLLLGLPPVAAARQDSAPPVSPKKAKRRAVAHKVVAHNATASADPGTSATTRTSKDATVAAPDPKSDPPPDPSGDGSAGPKVDTTQFDQEARAADQELQGRLSEMQKQFDDDAADIASKSVQNNPSADGDATPTR